MPFQAAPRGLVDALDRAEVDYSLVPHSHTVSAEAEAQALHVAPSQVVKTVVLVDDDGFVRAAIPASERLDLHKVRDVLRSHVRLATESELAGAYPEFALGAVPPLPFGHGDRVLVDIGVCGNENVLLDAGTHDESLRLRTGDLLEIAQASIVDICER
jgi:Ala-tRNA(Pro) deacylase